MSILTSKDISYAHGVSDVPLIGETIGDFFDNIVEKYSARDAVIARHQKIRYSYAEFRKVVELFARSLMRLGVQKGERVGIWAPNNIEC